MSPQDVTAVMTLLSVLKQMSSWPFGVVIFAMVIGPWIMAFMFWRIDSRRYQQQEKTYQDQVKITLEQYRQDVSEIKRLYESNSRLVMATNEAFKRLERIYGEAVSVISLNTQTQTNLAAAIKTNQYCPVVRQKGAPIL